jgi:DNA polymerase-3 subunit delta
MAELTYKNFESYLSGLTADGFAPVYLVFGDEYLTRSVTNALLDALVPPARRSFGYEPVDEDTESMADVVERLNTFSMMPGAKVISLLDSKAFHSRQDLGTLLKKCKSAWDAGDRKKSVRQLASLLGLAGVTAEEARTESGREALKYDDTVPDEGAFLIEALNALAENPPAVKEAGDPAKLLKDAIEKGFPKKHHLLITTEVVDKRKALYIAIKDRGVIIDCAVPKGDRKADKDAQDGVLRENMARLLKASGKRMDPDAYRYLCDMTGFDLRAFVNNLEKLIIYCGDRPAITLKDAQDLLKRSKQDPIYELSGALAERNLENALFFTGTLLANAMFPLQIMATIVNQLRRLILAKSFIMTLPRGSFQGNMDFNRFKTQIMPLVKDHDQNVQKRVLARETALSDPPAEGKKEKKIKAETDLILAKNPNSPYPVYLLFINANRYRYDELIRAYETACHADIRLKSTGENPKLVLDDLLIRIVRPMETAYDKR